MANKRVLLLLAEWFDSPLLASTRANDGLATTARSSVVFASLVTDAHGHWLRSLIRGLIIYEACFIHSLKLGLEIVMTR